MSLSRLDRLRVAIAWLLIRLAMWVVDAGDQEWESIVVRYRPKERARS